MKQRKKWILWALVFLLGIGLLALISVLSLNALVKRSASDYLLSPEQAAQLQDVDCVLVLGCGVHDDGTPSHMLEDRLKRGLELYQLGAAPKLLMSGDHGRQGYDEVATMKTFVLEQGVASSDVFMDHAGFSTYESMYRARDVFQVKKLIIISQGYHLYRSVYIARQLGMEAYGVAADYRSYSGQPVRDVREILARVKDVFTCIFQPEPTYLGDPIPIFGDGDETNDENWDFT